jgi:multicomponent K+:H+ antiporter subunit E
VRAALHRVLPHPVLSLTLVATWLLLNQTVALGHVLLGGALAVAVPLLTRAYWPGRPPFRRLPRLWRLALVVVGDVIVANLEVAYRTLAQRRASLRPGFAEIPLDLRDPYAIALLLGIISITPGTVSADLDDVHHVLLVHWLHEPDAAAPVARIKRRYEAVLLEVLG